MAIGIEIVGGGRNKISGGSINLKDKDSKAIVMRDTEENEVNDIQITIEDCSERFKEMLSTISNIKDDSINLETSKTFKEDVITRIPMLINASTKLEVETKALALISLLGNWITIKAGLTETLTPYISYLEKLAGN